MQQPLWHSIKLPQHRLLDDRLLAAAVRCDLETILPKHGRSPIVTGLAVFEFHSITGSIEAESCPTRKTAIEGCHRYLYFLFVVTNRSTS